MKRSQASDAPPFPAGSKVLARIHPLELERGILIPGHRLEPLRNASLPPWLVEIEDEGGHALDSRTVGLSLSDAALFYRLFGQAAFPFMVLGQADSNRQALERGQDAIIRIVAFDAAAFYGRHGLAAGDYACLELLDESGERFRLTAVRAADITADEREAFLSALAEGASLATGESNGSMDPAQCIRATFARCPASVLSSPKASFSEFFNEGRLLELREFGGSSFLCAKGQLLAPTERHDPSEFGDASELERAFIEADLSITEDEVAAFVMDALHAGRPAAEGVGRALAGLDEAGLPARARKRLTSLALDFADEVAGSYDTEAEPEEVAGIRSSLLDLHSEFIAWMRRVGGFVSDPRDMESETFSNLFSLMRHVSQLIAITNELAVPYEDYDEVDGAPDVEAFLGETTRELPRLGSLARALMDDATTELRGPRPGGKPARRPAAKERRERRKAPPSRRGKEPRRPDSLKTYVIQASLSGIEPPITRDLYVPGNRTLAELNSILQAAFGWQGRHLHLFQWKGLTYGEPSPDDFEPVIDEGGVTLDDLNPRRGSVMEYVYDFGDGWVHELRFISWKKAGARDREYPACLSGARAAPPEDCGGLPGYATLVEALAKPARARSRNEKEALAWAGRWDPERFDIDAVNERLSRMG